ncbi:hypothetical protein, partial [Propionibacterium acidifaciens]|uniref:hypothetical protein n=1 Tax=Propionibacterium acidifaciens TaxID=556499 RepID=UPI0023F25E0A
MQHPGLVSSHHQAGELRKYREEQPTDAKVVREVAKVMLQPAAEVIGVAISGQRMLLLKRLDMADMKRNRIFRGFPVLFR